VEDVAEARHCVEEVHAAGAVAYERYVLYFEVLEDVWDDVDPCVYPIFQWYRS